MKLTLFSRRTWIEPGFRAVSGAACCLWLFTGCSTAPVKPATAPAAAGQAAIQELNLLSMPMALNLDANPGADGIAVKLFASNAVSAKTVAIIDGKVEILMYDGIIATGAKDVPPPLHEWAFSSQELKPFASSTSIGIGYELVLAWGNDRPKMKNVTLIARCVSARGSTVYSGPVNVTVTSF